MDKLVRGLEQLGITLRADQIEAFRVYAEMVAAVPHNLTALRDHEGILVQHFLDSLVIMKYFELDYTKKFCDVGSGAGFPLMPLKIVCPEMDVTFIDSRQKSVEFLNDVIRRFDLRKCRTIHQHTTQMKDPEKGLYDYCLIRALSDVTYILENCLFLLKKGGELFLYKGPKHGEELRAVPKKMQEKILETEVREVQVPFLDRTRFIVRIKKA